MTLPTTTYSVNDLPGLNCGVCGLRSCEELANRLQTNPEMIKRCIYLSDNRYEAREIATENRSNPLNAPVIQTTPALAPGASVRAQPQVSAAACAGCASAPSQTTSFV